MAAASASVHAPRHPLGVALSSIAPGASAVRVLREALQPDADPRYALLLLAPDRVLRKQVVVLVDWTRSGRVQELAWSLYATALRRSQPPEIRLSKDIVWLLHYPRRPLDDIAFGHASAMLWARMEHFGDDARAEWDAVLRMRLIDTLTATEIAGRLNCRVSRVHGVLKEAAFAMRKARIHPNPLDRFRFGRELWGAFRLGWDPDGGAYVALPEMRPDASELAAVSALVHGVAWSHTAALDLSPRFDRAMPTQQSDDSDGSDAYVGLAEIFAGNAEQLLAQVE